jgi:hypothetical protein
MFGRKPEYDLTKSSARLRKFADIYQFLAMSDMPDDEFFKHDEWERYELILVPGVAGREGGL